MILNSSFNKMHDILKKLPQIFINNQAPKNPIVFVHGFNSSYEADELFYNNYKEADYYAFSLPGNNLLPATKEQLNVPYYAQLVAEFIKNKNLNNVILVGHSMGGGIISLVSALIPGLIYKMIFVAPMNKTSLVLKEVFFDDYFPQDVAGLHKFIKNLFFDPVWLEDLKFKKELEQNFNYELHNNQNIKILGKSLPQMKLMEQIENALLEIKVPTLLILGEKDGIIQRDECRAYFEKCIKNLQVKIVPKTGHMILKEATQTYIQIIDDFIKT